jgi:uroporphyrinogen decarboxylase
MTGKEHFLAIADRKSDHCGFWHGVPHDDSVAKLYAYFGVKDDFELGLKFGSICRFVSPEANNMWKTPDQPMGPGTPPMFDIYGGKEQKTLSQAGVFADYEDGDVDKVNNYHWRDPAQCDFTKTIEEIDKTRAAGQAVLSGTWGTFFRTTCCFFGMENCFMKMHSDSEVVDAVTKHVVDFYLAANEKLYKEAAGKIEALFFGNDFGTQRDLFISPEHFERFIMPYFARLTDQAHEHGLKVVLHSCGSIYRVIPRLIEAGVDILHPLQALAKNMDAEYLSERYKGKIAFMGGVDTQQLLPFGGPDDIKKEVRRLKKLFGPNYIVSPSHETLLPNVPLENVAAMMEAAME